MSVWGSSIWNSARSTVHTIFLIQDAIRLKFPFEEVRRLVQQHKKMAMDSKRLKTQRGAWEMARHLKELGYART